MRNLFTLLFAILCVVGNAQEIEVGLKGGVNLFHGDLTPNIIDIDALGFGGGVFARYHFNPKFDLRASANYGQYEGSDLNFENRANRGFSFESTLIDLTVGAEWNLLGVHIYENQKRFASSFTPYLHLGVGANAADATITSSVDGRPFDPMDLAREYPSFSMVVPMGLGLRYSIDKLVIGIEGTLTAGLNDYLDGISRSANQSDNDWYTSIGLTVAYRIGESASNYTDGGQPVEYFEEGEEYYEEDDSNN